eukprot:CAMPEP_0171649950 /NCGR_PEP_ID=MMETSP0990-20121206/37233_1 /TAXON_ID=483369 /ORGANISM="non described non described, Strain CCMP2098" /LENGTH=188 /DNA_ID=CAMNT_0012228215 /DNA_START=246 /DNA_END=812 /DNA_ORIENTATION=-
MCQFLRLSHLLSPQQQQQQQQSALFLYFSNEGAPVDESVEHGERGFGLVLGDQVPGFVHLKEREAATGAREATRSLGRRRVDRPCHVLKAGVRVFAAPGQCQRPRLVADPVAHEVHVPCVDQHWNLRLVQQVSHVTLVAHHPVRRESRVHVVVALRPRARRVGTDAHVQLLQHGRVVEEGFHVAEVVA